MSKRINAAIQPYVPSRSAEAIKAQLERAAVRDRDLDREVAADWFAVDREPFKSSTNNPRSRRAATLRQFPRP